MCIKLIIPPLQRPARSQRFGHYAWTSSETVVQVDGQGPFAITYVNPSSLRRTVQPDEAPTADRDRPQSRRSAVVGERQSKAFEANPAGTGVHRPRRRVPLEAIDAEVVADSALR